VDCRAGPIAIIAEDAATLGLKDLPASLATVEREAASFRDIFFLFVSTPGTGQQAFHFYSDLALEMLVEEGYHL
jgi:hypothetical protein